MASMQDFPALGPPPKKVARRIRGKTPDAVMVPLEKKEPDIEHSMPPAKKEPDLEHSMPLVKLSSETSLDETPSKKGGWMKCEHPSCPSPSDTLYKLTGKKRGYEHITNSDVRVCGSCRKTALPDDTALVEESHSEKQDKKRVWAFATEADVEKWKSDTVESIHDAYLHTATKPMQFALERWQLALRVARLIDTGTIESALAAQAMFKNLRLTRQKLSEAIKAWASSENKVEVVNNVPKSLQIGRFKTGWLTPKQKVDLVSWVRLRQNINVPIFKSEIMGCMGKFVAMNIGATEFTCTDAIYLDWRDWVRKNTLDSSFIIKTVKKAKALKQIEANALTRENLAAEMDRLEAFLRRHKIAEFDPASGKTTVTQPDRLWCCDEKGYNDEQLSGHTCLVTAGCVNPTSQHSKSTRHISVLSCVSAAGEAAPPAVVLTGTSWHPDWKVIWPNAVCAATSKGSFTAELFVRLIAESFVEHVRTVKAMTGCVQGFK